VGLTASDTQEAELDMLRAGARSFLVKGCSPEELLRTIHTAMRI
jgi:DNA-binding NarL/FixJ family response regulator